MSFKLFILEYAGSESAEAGTNANTIYITNHGLSVKDFIVNDSIDKTGIERGCRVIQSKTANEISIFPYGITGQVATDTIRLHSFVDRTNLIKNYSLNMDLSTDGNSSLSFTIISDYNYIPTCGQYIKFSYGSGVDAVKFYGLISEISIEKMIDDKDTNKLYINISCVGLKQIAARRSVSIDYPIYTSYGDIVEDMSEFLIQEGLFGTDISTGGYLAEQWFSRAVSIYDVLEQCAKNSNFQWNITENGILSFYEEPSSFEAAPYTIVDGGAFKDFWDIKITTKIDGYANKLFVNGGVDRLYGNDINVNSENFVESALMQQYNAGSGIYGKILQDASLINCTYATAGAGTTTTNIRRTAHGQLVGYMVWNATRNAYRQITAIVDANNFTVVAVTSQTTGDLIVYYNQANKYIKKEFKTCTEIPQTIEFKTRTLTFKPGQKLYVNLAKYGISASYYLIENISYTDEDINEEGLVSLIKATIRDNSNFTTNKNTNFEEYFSEF